MTSSVINSKKAFNFQAFFDKGFNKTFIVQFDFLKNLRSIQYYASGDSYNGYYITHAFGKQSNDITVSGTSS